MAHTVRVKVGVQSAVRHPEFYSVVALIPGTAYKSDDVLVAEYPWAFESDAERDAIVEQASASPGVKRAARRPAKK